MIIKSMARKDAGFRRLMDYFHRDDDGVAFARNCYHGADDRDAVIDAFERNHRFLPKRRNGNALYHEIIVLEQETGVPKNRQAEMRMAPE